MESAPELVQLVQAWFSAASSADTSLIAKHVPDAGTARLVGSDPDEWLRGGSVIAAFLRGEVEGAGGEVTFTPSETEAYRCGDVGWAATKLTIAMADGRKVTPRWTSVFELNDGVWQFVQTHASIAVANEDIGWAYD